MIASEAGRPERGLVPADRAAQLLGVRRSTLYAYVSRGLITSHRLSGTRGSWFDPTELDALARRGRGRGTGQRPDVVMESAITLIADGRYWYRGHDPIELSQNRTFEQVAELLWTGHLADSSMKWPADAAAVGMGSALADALPGGSTATDHLRVAVPLLAAHDPFRHDLRAEIIPAVGRRLLATLVSLLPRVGRRPATDSRFARKVWSLVSREHPDDNDLALVDQVLILLADHELAASTAAVRLAASFRADPYAATMAGLAVLSGAYHGAAGVEVERLFAEVEAEGATKAIGSRLSRTERLPGLGQVLYPEGDPRATALFDAARRHRPGHPTLDAVDEIVSISAQRGLPAPNVDFGTAALARVLGWKAGSTELLFSLARMAGWLAHAGEEYQHRSDIRLRAVYTGPLPDGA